MISSQSSQEELAIELKNYFCKKYPKETKSLAIAEIEKRKSKERNNYHPYWNNLLGIYRLLWPHALIYDKQEEIVQSVQENIETVVVAGNMLGKDYIAGFIAIAFFLTRTPCRIITTSADHSQLESVLWGEMNNFIDTSSIPLKVSDGGPLMVNHLHIRKINPTTGKVCRYSYIKGRVAAKGEGLLGHHVAEMGDGIPRTLLIADEASGVDDESWQKPDTWAKRKLAIGNPFPCTNFFKQSVKEGDLDMPKETKKEKGRR